MRPGIRSEETQMLLGFDPRRARGWEMAYLRALLERPDSNWNLYVKLRREGDYLAAAAVRQERLSDLLILMRLRESGLRAFISAN
jgi:hypothetical protein